MCVPSHVRERGGQVDEPGEAADEVDAHEGVLVGRRAAGAALARE